MASQLGANYIIHERIGRGAFGEVWRGARRDGGGSVAVKMLRHELTVDPLVVTRFLRERDILVGLDHPNVVSVLDLVAEGGKLSIVMQLVEGGDLRHYLCEQGAMASEAVCALLAQVAAGLAAAHAAGVVHRDLKPENVLVDRIGDGAPRVRITDFGVAHLAGQPRLTRRSGIVGTPTYTAPETAAGHPTTPAVDVYALGIMAYELVYGHPPFEADNTWALLRKHIETAPPRPPEAPDALWDVIASCLAKDPRARPGASTLAGTLTSLAGDRARPAPPGGSSQGTTVTPARPASRPRHHHGGRRMAALTVSIVALLSAGLSWVAVRQNEAPPQPPPSATATTPSGSTLPGPGTDWVAYDFDQQPLGTAGAARQFPDTSGHGNDGVVRVLPPGVITVTTHSGQGHAIKFPDPCTPTPGSPCPRAVVQTADPSDLNARDRDFTYGVELLVQPPETIPGATIVQKGRAGRRDSSQWKLQLETGGTVSCVVVAKGSGAAYRALSTVRVADGGWHRIRCTRRGAELTIEVDSSQPVSAALPPALVFESDAPLRLGGNSNTVDNDQYSGELDNVFFRLEGS
jgi:serine/threonine protein kinase